MISRKKKRPWQTHSAPNKSLVICFFYNLISQTSWFDCTLNLHWVRKRSLWRSNALCNESTIVLCSVTTSLFSSLAHYIMVARFQKPNNFFLKKPVRNTKQPSCMSSTVSHLLTGRWEPERWGTVFMCVYLWMVIRAVTFPAKLFLHFTSSTKRKPTKPPGVEEGEGDRLLPRARHRKPVVKTPNLADVNLFIFMHIRSCVVVYFYIYVSVCTPLCHNLIYNTCH